MVKRPEAIPYFVPRAFRMETSGGHGAVRLGLPKDVLSGEIGAVGHMHAEEDWRM